MPLYETTFIARQELSRQDVGKLADQLTSIVETGGGKVVKNEYWGLRPLAYRIRKHRKGHYTMLGLDAPPAAVKEMQRNLGINEDVLRNLTVRVEAISDEPSPMLNTRSGRDEEGESEFTESRTQGE